jgi:hypothetical protein
MLTHLEAKKIKALVLTRVRILTRMKILTEMGILTEMQILMTHCPSEPAVGIVGKTPDCVGRLLKRVRGLKLRP